MHRHPLLGKLARYKPVDDEERRMHEAITAFVKEHPECFERSLNIGHVTGSAWVVDREKQHVLLIHHRKLDRWLQPGGHADGDPDVLSVALREAREESGLAHVSPVLEEIFDVDVHLIPARGDEPAHYHYDIRFLLQADRSSPLVLSEESHDLRWVPLEKVETLSRERSILRMLEKLWDLEARATL